MKFLQSQFTFQRQYLQVPSPFSSRDRFFWRLILSYIVPCQCWPNQCRVASPELLGPSIFYLFPIEFACSQVQVFQF